MKATILKNGAVVTFERLFPSGLYLVLLRDTSGNVADKVRTDDYHDAICYKKSFLAIAKNYR